MALSQSTDLQSQKQAVGRPKIVVSKPNQILNPISMDELTPLQRQRLDAAVMMLVNYLVSVSSDT